MRKPRPFRSNQNPVKLPWREVPVDLLDSRARRMMVNEANAYLRAYRLGECSVIVTRELGKWHLSIAHPRRYPTWDEVAQARYNALPAKLWVAMILPPPAHYVNVHEFCFQLIETDYRSS
jgi:hypothetical protein